MLNHDPLKITYVVVHAEDSLEEMSPLQGFGASWPSTLWALRVLAVAPASIPERGWPLEGLIAQRMGGANTLNWLPLLIAALEKIGIDDLGFVTVLMTGSDDVATRVGSWCEKQPRPALHVREKQITNDAEAIAFCDVTLLEHCRTIVEGFSEMLSAPRLVAARNGLGSWMRRKRIPTNFRQVGHNVALPNEMVLTRAERLLVPGKPFIGKNESDYDELAVQSAQAVLELRAKNGFRDFNRIFLPRPGLILTEPALYRPSYAAVPKNKLPTKPMRDALRRLQKQTALWSTITLDDATALMNDIQAQAVIAMRQEELATHFHGVGLMAAQTCSAVLRLRPGVNHVFPALLRYAGNIRTESSTKRLKTLKLFSQVQQHLADSIGTSRIKLIAGYNGSIKIVADSPLELLPVGDLTLALRNDVSRICATPGNLMMGKLIQGSNFSVTLADLCKVLVVSGFSEDDNLKNLMKVALHQVKAELNGKVEVSFINVKSRAEFINALNGSDASILVFDGHGCKDAGKGIGGVVIDGDPVDVWGLRGEARIPPIVILSACDTHSIDALTHATVGNGFLAAGALTVLATLMPIDGRSGAAFIARLLFRLGHFIPVALMRSRCVNWNEVISGFLRMDLAMKTTRSLVKDTDLAIEIANGANFEINIGHPDWYESLLSGITAATGTDPAAVRSEARAVMARSEAIRYIQLGNPEVITIDDGSIEEDVLSARAIQTGPK